VFALAWAASWFFSRSPRALRVRAE